MAMLRAFLPRRAMMRSVTSRTGLPAALTSAAYNDANQIATWGGTSFTYDANGNLTSDGLRSYTWDARNQLTGISGVATDLVGLDPTGFTVFGGEVLLAGYDIAEQLGLWLTNGTAAGTHVCPHGLRQAAAVLSGIARANFMTAVQSSGSASSCRDF